MRYSALLLVLLTSLAWGDDRTTLVGPDGGDVELQPAEGQLLILHFWATWCPRCAEDIHRLQNAAAGCRAESVRVVLVNVGEDDEAIREFTRKHDVRLPVLRDPEGRLWRQTDGRGLPANLFWSNAGRRTELGPKTEKQWGSVLVSHGCSAKPI